MSTCRICYEPGELECLCDCRGTVEFVHKECIQKWIKISDKRVCELCGAKFKVDVTKSDEEKKKNTCYVIQIFAFTYTVLCIFIIFYWTVIKGF